MDLINNIPLWIYPLVIWTLIWKGMGLWKAARNNNLKWFLAMIILNTAGILPLIYLVWFQGKSLDLRTKKTKNS